MLPGDRDRSNAFLGVEQSLTGRRWRQRGGDDLIGLALAQRLGVPEVVGRVLAARGVEPEDAAAYLDPTLRRLMPDPSCLKDLDRAVERLADAVKRRETVWVFGDYDVDGATSAALLRRFLEALDVPVAVYIPDRRTEGYGPNSAALTKLRDLGATLVVTVDCGTLAHEPLETARAVGLDVVVIDHHAAEARLPPAIAIVNPNRLDDRSGLGTLAAVGVAFLLLVGLNRFLRQAGFYGDRAPPDLMEHLDLVALGTICDVVPLNGLNRALVAQGIKVMGGRRKVGLVALADAARVAERLDAYHLGFLLGPRVNAGGRVGRSDLGCRLLSTEDPTEARRLAEELDRLNEERRAIEADVLMQAIASIDAEGGAAASPVVLAEGQNWHPGVIGIVASRLKERYNRPACVIAWEGSIGKGSGRSVAGVDLGAAIIAAREAGLLVAGGGHLMAAGFTVEEQAAPAFRRFLAARIGATFTGAGLIPELGVDGALQLGACAPALCETLAALGPFGAGNAEPRFALPQVKVLRADPVGNGHVRCILAPPVGGDRLKAIAFRAMESPLGPALMRRDGMPLHIAGHLRADRWQGRDDVQLLIDDAAPATSVGQ